MSRNIEQSHPDFTRCWVSAQSVVSAYVRMAVRDTQHAEDVLQEVAQAAVESFETYDPARPFVAWVLGIARFRILSYYRQVRGDRHQFSDRMLELVEAAYLHEQPQVSARAQALGICMEQVQGRARQVVQLHYGENKAVQDIADDLGVTPNAISRQLYRVRDVLRRCIEQRLAAGGAR